MKKGRHRDGRERKMKRKNCKTRHSSVHFSPQYLAAVFSQSARFGLTFLSYLITFLAPGVTEVAQTKLEDCEQDQAEKRS